MREKILGNLRWMRNAVPVEEIDSSVLLPADFQHYVDKNRPVIIRNAIAEWPAVAKWGNFDYLRNRVGHYPISAYPHSNLINQRNQAKGEVKVSFSQGLDMLQDAVDEDAELSIPNLLIDQETFTELAQDTPSFKFLDQPKPPLGFPPSRLFIYKRAGTSWHQHICDGTLLCQITGTKQVGLLAASKKTNRLVERCFMLDLYYEDENCFSELADQTLAPFIATLEKGDALYIPPFWWHGVTPIDDAPGISLARTWRTPWHIQSDFRTPGVRKFWRLCLRQAKLTALLLPVMMLLNLGPILKHRISASRP